MNDNGATKEGLYHAYNFELFDIKDMEYEKEHRGFGKLHSENCPCCKGNHVDGNKKVTAGR